jgi:hypothetical protein
MSEVDIDVDDAIDDGRVFVRFDIATYPSDLILSVLYQQWKNKDIIIPEFQRAYVWKQNQASLLIESFLLGLPVPSVFFYVDENNKSVVIDGQQRITTIGYYFDGYFGPLKENEPRRVFKLTGLASNSPFNGKQFTDLSESDQRKLRNAVLRAINIRQLSPVSDASSIYYIFERLNTGGTPLKAQEIRNCVYRGDIVKELQKLNEDNNWRLLLGSLSIDRHQRDIELILRLIALYENIESYEKPMNAFLNNAMSNNKDFNSSSIKKFKKLFKTAVLVLAENLGKKPFTYGSTTNSAILESVILSVLRNSNKDIVSEFKKRYQKLLKNKDFKKSVTSSTTDVLAITTRNNLADSILFA